MKQYILQAAIGEQKTTVQIMARDTFTAKVLATNQIRSSYVSDRRWAIGEITLKDSEGKEVWKIEAEKTKEK